MVAELSSTSSERSRRMVAVLGSKLTRRTVGELQSTRTTAVAAGPALPSRSTIATDSKW